MEQRILDMQKSTQQSHTFASHTGRYTSQSLQKSVPAPPEKKFNFFLPSLWCFNFFATHIRHDKSAKTTTDKDYNNSTDRTPAGNSTLPKVAVTCFVGQFCGYINFRASMNVCAVNRHLRQAANRS